MVWGLVLFLLPPSLASTTSSVFRIQWQVQLQNPGHTDAQDVVATILVFDNRSGWVNQQVLWEDIPGEVLRNIDNRVAIFRVPRLRAGTTESISFEQLVKVDRTELDLDLSTGTYIPPEYLPLTLPIDRLWENHPDLVSKVAELCDNVATPVEKLRRIFEFVKGYLTYRQQGEEHGALWAYRNRVGDCTEFTNLLIALCRLSGIPAKFVSAIGYSREKANDLYSMGHAFALVYLPGLEWVPVDATWSSPRGELGESSEDKLVMLVSDGWNLLKDSGITVPKDRVNYSYVGTDPGVRLLSQATILKEVGLEVSLDAAGELRDSTWEWYVTVRNVGSVTVNNLSVRISADNEFLEVPPPVTLDELLGGHNRVFTLEVGVKRSAENLPVVAEVEYETPYGVFSAKAEAKASPTLYESPLSSLEKYFVAMRSFLAEHYLFVLLVLVGVVGLLLARRF